LYDAWPLALASSKNEVALPLAIGETGEYLLGS
jgi:hypothetical protein